MICTHCNADLGWLPQASIAILVAGDEVVHAYFRCAACGLWSIEHLHDHFMTGETQTWHTGPYSDEIGRRCIELVEACPAPRSKLCDCASHAMLYDGTPS